MIDPRTPVLIGGGQRTWRDTSPPPPAQMMAEASWLAAANAGLSPAQLAGVDLAAVVGFTVDGTSRGNFPRLANPVAALTGALGVQPRREIYSYTGGDSPQALVSFAAEEIAAGRHDLVLLSGAEFLGALTKRLAAGADLAGWDVPADPPQERFGDPRAGCSEQERAYGLALPINTYPMFENAVRAQRGRTLEAHARALGALFAPFTQIAAANPNAWFPVARRAEELIAETPQNRMVGFPYTKFLNSVIHVNQAASVIMCASAKADEFGVPHEKRVYLHGCADAADLWNPLDRTNYYSSPAIRLCARDAFAMAAKKPADLTFIDLYSCFPVAVEMACQEIGLAENDPRGLTITGGLPYFGGAGSNYVMHSIATMMEKLRAKPGAFGLCTANGWHLTKHAFGIYSTTPTQGSWRRSPPKSRQAEIEAMPHPEIVCEPEGEAVIETYTVTHAQDRVRAGIVIGRDAHGRRFIASTPEDEATLLDLKSREGVGRKGRVVSGAGGIKNVFTPY